VTIDENYCILQDCTTGIPIGVGEQRDGVYHYDKMHVKKMQACDIQTGHLWHQRMGHPLGEVVSILLNSLNCSNSNNWNNNVCEVYFCAKKTRTHFSVSYNKAKELIDIIHYDIWGPYRLPSSCGAHYFLTLANDFSRSVWVHLMKAKIEKEKLLKGFVTFVKTI